MCSYEQYDNVIVDVVLWGISEQNVSVTKSTMEEVAYDVASVLHQPEPKKVKY